MMSSSAALRLSTAARTYRPRVSHSSRKFIYSMDSSQRRLTDPTMCSQSSRLRDLDVLTDAQRAARRRRSPSEAVARPPQMRAYLAAILTAPPPRAFASSYGQRFAVLRSISSVRRRDAVSRKCSPFEPTRRDRLPGGDRQTRRRTADAPSVDLTRDARSPAPSRCACPIRPKPVTSVQACTAPGRQRLQRLGRGPVQRAHRSRPPRRRAPASTRSNLTRCRRCRCRAAW